MHGHGARILAWGLALALALGMLGGAEAIVAPLQAQESALSSDAQMRRVQLLLKKLRESMQSLNDLDDLEKAGMPKKDVDRMRRALKAKIQEMINETIASIREL